MSPMRSGESPAVRIDADNERAWCGERALSLTPRALAVLRHLVEHAERLITKDDLLATVWRDAIVSDAALASCIRDLRRALGDSSGAPRYIQTVHRRGFRFIGPIARSTVPGSARAAIAPAQASPRAAGPSALASAVSPRSAAGAAPGGTTLVGRDAEVARLHERLATAMTGQRQLVFVTGEPGIGKTALVEAFLADVDAADVRIGRGQCVEQYGPGEAYLPVLEAL